MASLIVGADGTAMDPSDREAAINAAEPVPGIEAADINDGDIINQTQSIDCGNGMMKYSITLPGGHPLECTPFLVERRRDMSKVWIATVRQQIVERAGAAAAATRAASLKAIRDKQMQGAGIQVAGQIPTPEEARALAQAIPPKPADPAIADAIVHQRRVDRQSEATAPAASEDPVEYAQQQYDRARAELEHWRNIKNKATKNEKAAQKAAEKWQLVLMSIEGEEADAPVAEPPTRAARAAARLKTGV